MNYIVERYDIEERGTPHAEEERMPRHDDRPDADLAITVVFLIVMIAVLFLLGLAHPYNSAHVSDISYHSVPAVPPM